MSGITASNFWRALFKILTRLFQNSGEDFAPGVKKFGPRQNDPTNYVFLPEIVQGMSLEVFAQRLQESGLLEQYRFTTAIEKGNGVIRLVGYGFRSNDLPRVIFSGDRVRLMVPWSLEVEGDNRDWNGMNGIVQRMRALFDQPTGTS